MSERLGIKALIRDMARVANLRGQVSAINKGLAIIEFALDGTILTANDNFLEMVGYSLPEIKGRHHRMFVAQREHGTSAYRAFWEKLGRGEFDEGEYQRIAKSGCPLWLQASYNPILGWNGKPLKVVNFAIDITDQKTLAAEIKGMVAAIGKAQDTIEFRHDGGVAAANDNSLQILGYCSDSDENYWYEL